MFSRLVVGAVLAAVCVWQSGCSQPKGPQATAPSSSPDGLWTRVEDGDALKEAPQSFDPARGLVAYRVRDGQMREALLRAPLEFSEGGGEKVTVYLPKPGGSYEQFEVEESPVMSPGLAERFPQFKTYKARGLGDRTTTARIEYTPSGLRAMVLSSSGTFFVGPLPDAAAGDLYVPFAKKDVAAGGTEFRCFTDPAPASIAPAPKEAGEEAPANPAAAPTPDARAGRLLKYKLAVATTGEYVAAAHRPDDRDNPNADIIEDALEAIVLTVSHVNLIFERDLGVRLELIDDETKVIFQDAANDPYEVGDPDSDQDASEVNRDVLNDRIGPENYDIGHLFATAGGGVAAQACVCNDEHKGEASSGAPDPLTTAFDVGYVAHEMAHQFGASHSFNGTTGYCATSSWGRVAERAYEPGSGSTLMSYAGLSSSGEPFCGWENIQQRCDEYLHAVSLWEIDRFLSTPSHEACPKPGGSCAEIITTGNRRPRVSAGPDRLIPKGTPFTLRAASASDPDGDALTYVWEQFDNAVDHDPPNPHDPHDFKKIKPLFRSREGMGDPSRTFPHFAHLLAPPGVYTAEALPLSARDMTFRLTARDGRGHRAFDEVILKVVGNAGPFKVNEPAAGVAWRRGTRQTVRWDVASTQKEPVSCGWVRILLFVGEGRAPVEMLGRTENDGEAEVLMPADAPTTERARVLVEAVDNVFFNVSPGDFRVVP